MFQGSDPTEFVWSSVTNVCVLSKSSHMSFFLELTEGSIFRMRVEAIDTQQELVLTFSPLLLWKVALGLTYIVFNLGCSQEVKKLGASHHGAARGVDSLGQGEDTMVSFHSDHYRGYGLLWHSPLPTGWLKQHPKVVLWYFDMVLKQLLTLYCCMIDRNSRVCLLVCLFLPHGILFIFSQPFDLIVSSIEK